MIVAVDIGGTKCQVATARPDGTVLSAVRFDTTDKENTLQNILEAVDGLRPGEAPVFGVSCGGPLDSQRGVILSPPNLPGWDSVPITTLLTERFGGSAFLMNDANAGALAEWQFGAGRGARSMVFLTHGTGMGGGLILDGRLYEGTSGDAGEIGHVRMAPDGPVGYGKAGSFEGFCSGAGIARLAHGRIPGLDRPTAKQVAEAAEQGNPQALAVLEESGRWLGRGLAILVDVLNPEVIVLGSVYTRSGRFLEAAMREELAREALPSALSACRIVPAELGERLGLAAAVAVAVYRQRSQ
ncbi:MAG: ROK family protein [Victivallales bacterium]|nr:ROK family protein [Victivallales bacterium]